MRHFLAALLTTTLASGYLTWCCAILLSLLSLLVPPLEHSTTFYITLLYVSVPFDIHIFGIQVKKPASS